MSMEEWTRGRVPVNPLRAPQGIHTCSALLAMSLYEVWLWNRYYGDDAVGQSFEYSGWVELQLQSWRYTRASNILGVWELPTAELGNDGDQCNSGEWNLPSHKLLCEGASNILGALFTSNYAVAFSGRTQLCSWRPYFLVADFIGKRKGSNLSFQRTAESTSLFEGLLLHLFLCDLQQLEQACFIEHYLGLVYGVF